LGISFKNYVKNLQELLKSDPASGDFQVVTGSFGEFCSEQHSLVQHSPSIGHYDKGGFEVYQPDDFTGPAESDLNAVKVN
jgi:hypothetical protein